MWKVHGDKQTKNEYRWERGHHVIFLCVTYQLKYPNVTMTPTCVKLGVQLVCAGNLDGSIV